MLIILLLIYYIINVKIIVIRPNGQLDIKSYNLLNAYYVDDLGKHNCYDKIKNTNSTISVKASDYNKNGFKYMTLIFYKL